MWKNELSDKVLTVIPARGGSKGIPKKNLQKILGRSLTEWAILSALRIQFETTIVLSSDSPEILQLSEKFESVIPSKRPDALSGDYVADYQVLRHELQMAEDSESTKYSCVVMLQPTSPLRHPETVNYCIEQVLKKSHSAAWTVSAVPVKFHPRKQLYLDNSTLRMSIKSPLVVARQELEPSFIRNGACYAISRDTLLEDETLLGPNSLAVIQNWPTINIDEPSDMIEASEMCIERDNILVPKEEII